MTDSAPMYKLWEKSSDFLEPEYVLNKTLVGVSNVIIDNAPTTILDMKIESEFQYGYEGEYAKFKIMGARTIDYLLLGINGEKIVLSALVKKGVAEEKVVEELNVNLINSQVIYNFVDSVRLVNN